MKAIRSIMKAAVVGASLTGAAAYASCRRGDKDLPRINFGEIALIWGAAGGVAGAIIGGLAVAARALRNR